MCTVYHCIYRHLPYFMVFYGKKYIVISLGAVRKIIIEKALHAARRNGNKIYFSDPNQNGCSFFFKYLIKNLLLFFFPIL